MHFLLNFYYSAEFLTFAVCSTQISELCQYKKFREGIAGDNPERFTPHAHKQNGRREPFMQADIAKNPLKRPKNRGNRQNLSIFVRVFIHRIANVVFSPPLLRLRQGFSYGVAHLCAATPHAGIRRNEYGRSEGCFRPPQRQRRSRSAPASAHSGIPRALREQAVPIARIYRRTAYSCVNSRPTAKMRSACSGKAATRQILA